MKSSAFAAISSCVLFFMVIVVSPKLVSTAPSESDSGTSKTKREAGGPSGLFPFPRIGRSGTDTWFFDTSDIENNNAKNERYNAKREGLFPFPRIGRSPANDNAQNYAKRQGLVPFPRIGRSGGRSVPQGVPGAGGPADNNGLWFGPRLGRLQKRDAMDSPWALVTLREFPSISSRRQPEAFTPRLGRESNEDFWDYEDRDHQKDHA
uniref:Cardioacceleratory peptide 2b splicing variant b n=1 Tax=Nilaparvata lugens TaxID=108931 RepID=U3U425_NILLU|nr:cardioacceleratory peptide 2b splicing variant b [Nilaparvata lugens]